MLRQRTGFARVGCGAEGDRTLDLRIATATLAQLSYRPIETTAGTPRPRRAILASPPPGSNPILTVAALAAIMG